MINYYVYIYRYIDDGRIEFVFFFSDNESSKDFASKKRVAAWEG